MIKPLAVILLFIVSATLVAQPQFNDSGSRVQPKERRCTWVDIEYTYDFFRDPPDNTQPYKVRHIYRHDMMIAASGPMPWYGKWDDLQFYVEDDNFYVDRFEQLPNSTNTEDQIIWIQALDAVYRENPGGVVDLSDYLP